MKSCDNEECSVSTGIHERLTFGSGDIDFNGYWEIPCPICARAHEAKFPEDGECWPFVGQDVEELKKSWEKDLFFPE